MEKLLETLSPNVGMTLIICATVLILATILAITFSIWRHMEIKAEKENKKKEPNDANTQNKAESPKANTSKEALTPQEEALKAFVLDHLEEFRPQALYTLLDFTDRKGLSIDWSDASGPALRT